METFNTVDGSTIDLGGEKVSLKVEHVLQKYRDTWLVVKKHPYLAIDKVKVDEYIRQLVEFPVFTQSILYQNIAREEIGQRLIAKLASPGITAGFSAKSDVLVEGRANPQAHGIITINNALYIGMHPFCALGTKYIYVDADYMYQHTIGELVIVNKHSRPSSSFFDFNPLAELLNEFHTKYINGNRRDLTETQELEKLLDNIFVENGKAIVVAETHHKSLSPYTAAHDYKAPLLTKYGRLTHDHATGTPRIEISFALLHYEKAIREFHLVKQASASGVVDDAFSHGVFCVIALAACIEAISNNLVFFDTGTHPTYKDRRKPLEKINDAGSALSARYGRTFSPLLSGQTIYDAIDSIRVMRNMFMHAKELETDIEPTTQQSIRVVAVDEAKCRDYLKQLRLGVALIFNQLPEIAAPIVTRENVKWLGNLEVP